MKSMRLLWTIIALWVWIPGQAQSGSKMVKQMILNEFRTLSGADSLINREKNTIRVHYTVFSRIGNGSISRTKDSITVEVLANNRVRILKNQFFDMVLGKSRMYHIDHIKKQILERQLPINPQKDFFAASFSKETVQILEDTRCEITDRDDSGVIYARLTPVPNSAVAGKVNHMDVSIDSKTGRLKSYTYHYKMPREGQYYSQHMLIHTLDISKAIAMPRNADEYYRTKKGQLKTAFQSYKIIKI